MNWECPYCGAAQVVTNDTYRVDQGRIYQNNVREGPYAWRILSVVCANGRCLKLHLVFNLHKRQDRADGGYAIGDVVQTWRLLPGSEAKPQPEFIPQPLRDDYYEACQVRNLSQKASATLARRCIQGMIRDFCGIQKHTLKAEIDALRTKIDEGTAPVGVLPETIDAIDHVRSIGNIGAHMKKDVNLVIDVDPDEAQLLIGLIELLFKEWYVAAEARKPRLQRIKALAAAKQAERKQAGTPSLDVSSEAESIDPSPAPARQDPEVGDPS